MLAICVFGRSFVCMLRSTNSYIDQHTRFLHLLHRQWENAQKSPRFSHTNSMDVCRAWGGFSFLKKGVRMFKGVRVRIADLRLYPRK